MGIPVVSTEWLFHVLFPEIMLLFFLLREANQKNLEKNPQNGDKNQQQTRST